jgi:hypothetical protein
MVQARALGSSSSVRFKGVANRGTAGDGASRPVYLGLSRQPGGGQPRSDRAVDYAPRRDVIRWGNPPAPAW